MATTNLGSVRPKHRQLIADTLAGSVATLLLLQVFQRAIGFGRGIIFCRWLAPEELGQWEMAFSFLMLAGPAAVLSLHAALGRYLEYYRVRGQLRTFLARMAAATTGLALLSTLAIWRHLPWFSALIFGREDLVRLTGLLTACLLAVIGQNFMTDLFTALRLQRVASGLQVLHSLLFAVLAVVLLMNWKMTASSLILAYAAASGVSIVVSGPWLWLVWRSTSGVAERQLAPAVIWTRVVPYVLSVWLANWLNSLFAMVDRYMIVHHSGLSSQEALAQVGQYHCSRLAPILFVTIAGLLSGILTPHLSHDWEAGRKREVSDRLSLIMRVFGFVLCAAGVIVLWGAPSIFEWLFHGKFSGGLAVLPATLTYCAWGGLAFVARAYLNCAEKAWSASLAYVVGLAVNIVLNLAWLPSYGLAGAVWATVAGNLITLTLILLFSRLRGMQFGLNTALICALPISFCLGPWSALVILVVTTMVALWGKKLFSSVEKQVLRDLVLQGFSRLRVPWPRRRAAPAVANG